MDRPTPDAKEFKHHADLVPLRRLFHVGALTLRVGHARAQPRGFGAVTDQFHAQDHVGHHEGGDKYPDADDRLGINRTENGDLKRVEVGLIPTCRA